MDDIEKLKYPIGKPNIPLEISQNELTNWIKILNDFPIKLTLLTSSLTNQQLDTPYREGGWTIRQVVHHCADSHHHSYIRFKWTLTEEEPMIKAYHEDRWATLFDYTKAPIEMSLLHLKAVHAKLVYLINGLSEKELRKSFIHPEGNKRVVLKENIGIYVAL